MTSSTFGGAESFLVLAPTGRDSPLTCSLLRRAGMGAIPCRDAEELCLRYQRDGAAGIMIAEEALTARSRTRIKALLDDQEPWSDLPIFIFRSAVATSVARRLLDLGNVALLDRPLQQVTMLSAANAGFRSRKRQYAARAALEEQQRAVKQRDQFLAMLGHELRNPLAAISMAIELESEGDKHREIIQRQARHLTRLVDDLLDVARVTSGKVVLKRSLVDLGELVRRALETVRPIVLSQGLRVTMHAPARTILLEADAVRLEQIVVNLLGNAAKYTPAGGHIEIVSGREGHEAVITVRDDGVGIAKEMLPRVFDLFAQVEGSLARSKGGMGIGLTLVRNLVTLHGGDVEARSAGLGRGSIFTVRLPGARDGASDSEVRAAHPAVSAAPSLVAPGGREVLIVEDNEDSRDLLTSMLQRRGYRVSAAPDGPRGVELALRDRPEVILVDIGLPGLDGYGVARAVRQELGQSVFLIALTGYGQPEDRERALQAGFDIHLTKPVDIVELQRLLLAPERQEHAAQ